MNRDWHDAHRLGQTRLRLRLSNDLRGGINVVPHHRLTRAPRSILTTIPPAPDSPQELSDALSRLSTAQEKAEKVVSYLEQFNAQLPTTSASLGGVRQSLQFGNPMLVPIAVIGEFLAIRGSRNWLIDCTRRAECMDFEDC